MILRLPKANLYNSALHYYVPNGDEDVLIDIEAAQDGSATLRVVIGDLELGAKHSTSVIVTLPSLKHLKQSLAKWKPFTKAEQDDQE